MSLGAEASFKEEDVADCPQLSFCCLLVIISSDQMDNVTNKSQKDFFFFFFFISLDLEANRHTSKLLTQSARRISVKILSCVFRQKRF